MTTIVRCDTFFGQENKFMAKKARGRRGGDVVRMFRIRMTLTMEPVVRHKRWQWVWKRYAPNGEYICGSLPETFHRRIDCLASAKRAMTVCEIVIEK